MNRYTPVEEARQPRRFSRARVRPASRARCEDGRTGCCAWEPWSTTSISSWRSRRRRGSSSWSITNRPIRYEENEQGASSLDYPFAVILLEIDGFGRGEGRFFPSSALRVQPDGALDVYQYAEGEGRVTDVKKVR